MKQLETQKVAMNVLNGKVLALKDVLLEIFACQLRNEPGNPSVLNDAHQIWDAFQAIGHNLEIKPLESLKKRLLNYEDYRYAPEKESEEMCSLIDPNDLLEFKPTENNPFSGGFAPCRINNVYAAELFLMAEGTFSESDFKNLGKKLQTLALYREFSMGQTLILRSELDEAQPCTPQDLLLTAQTCANAFFEDLELSRHLTLLGSPMFEFASWSPDPRHRKRFLCWLILPENASLYKAHASELQQWWFSFLIGFQALQWGLYLLDRQATELDWLLKRFPTDFSKSELPTLKSFAAECADVLEEIDGIQERNAANRNIFARILDALEKLPQTEVKELQSLLFKLQVRQVNSPLEEKRAKLDALAMEIRYLESEA